jgi:hypothetical protein
MEMHSKMCTYDINMKPTFPVNLRKLQVSHMCRNTLYYTALYKEADHRFLLSSYLAPSALLLSAGTDQGDTEGSKSKREQS